MLSWEQRIEKARMNAQLFGYSWAGATFSSVNSFFSKNGKGKA